MSNAVVSLAKPLRTVFALALIATGTTGCALHHPVTFENTSYDTNVRRQSAAIVAVIDENTLEKKVPIRAWVTGQGNIWEVQAGDMLKQVADVELQQMFTDYSFATRETAPPGAKPGIVLALTIPSYIFADTQATVTVKAVGRARNGKVLFEKTYVGQGPAQVARMVVLSSVAMKSAIRESSLNAYKEVFKLIRADLERALVSNQVVAR